MATRDRDDDTITVYFSLERKDEETVVFKNPFTFFKNQGFESMELIIRKYLLNKYRCDDVIFNMSNAVEQKPFELSHMIGDYLKDKDHVIITVHHTINHM